MRTAPRVSIVLPTYNGEKFIDQSITSILSQDFTDWELIVVNDCSTDKTKEIVTNFADQDSRIKVINNKTNKKLPASLNIGFSDARGEYFTWTSDDNIAKHNWLSTLVNALDSNPDISMVVANMDYIDQNNKTIGNTAIQYNKRSPKQLAYTCNVGAAFMYRKSAADTIGKYDESTFCAEDYDYWCRIALNGNIKYITDNIYKYREHNASLTATKKDQQIKKTVLINKKYYTQFITRFHFNWFEQQKILFLLQPHVKKPLLYPWFKLYQFCAFQISNILFFWNSDLRHIAKSKLKIKL